MSLWSVGIGATMTRLHCMQLRAVALFLLTSISILGADSQDAADQRPTLEATLEWMHDAFPNSQSISESQQGQSRELFVDAGEKSHTPNCKVTIVEHWIDQKKQKKRNRQTTIDLSLIDPKSIVWYTDHTLIDNTGTLSLSTTNNREVISEQVSEEVEGDHITRLSFSSRVFLNFMPEYAQRYMRAFSNAVQSCGGKPSVF